VKASGGISEVAELTVKHSEPLREGGVTLTVAGKTLKADIPHPHDFGEERVEFNVPEVNGPTEVEARVHLGGRLVKSRLNFIPQRKWTIYLAPHAHLDIASRTIRRRSLRSTIATSTGCSMRSKLILICGSISMAPGLCSSI
jgi:hypothetical protein